MLPPLRTTPAVRFVAPEKLQRVAGDAEHEVPVKRRNEMNALGGRRTAGFMLGRVEILAALDHGRPE
jgi:hypothetical protein